MALSGALRSNQRNGAYGPIDPAVDQGERSFVARSAEKIGAVEAFPMIERETELASQGGIGHYRTVPGAPITR